jgi:RNA polymerase sigma-70 factor (ECF subfamily)
MPDPKTNTQLLLRVRDASDHEAWAEFAEIYCPVIVRLAKTKGMQDADAEDLSQRVLISIAAAIDRFEPDADRARFRTWLRRVAENAILNALTRGRREESGDESIRSLLEREPATFGPDSDLLRIEYRREIFQLAARQIRYEFEPATWEAFWQTAVEGRDIDQVAAELGKQRGSIYAARSRVIRRLKQKVLEFGDEV